MYKSRIDRQTTISYSNGTLLITQEEENWGSCIFPQSFAISITNIYALQEALNDIEKEIYGEW